MVFDQLQLAAGRSFSLHGYSVDILAMSQRLM